MNPETLQLCGVLLLSVFSGSFIVLCSVALGAYVVFRSRGERSVFPVADKDEDGAAFNIGNDDFEQDQVFGAANVDSEAGSMPAEILNKAAKFAEQLGARQQTKAEEKP